MKIGLIIICFMLILAIGAASVVFAPVPETVDPAEVSRTTLELYKKKHMYADASNEFKTLIDLIPDDSDYDTCLEMYNYIKGLDYADDSVLSSNLNWALFAIVKRNPGNTSIAKEYLDNLKTNNDKNIYENIHILMDITSSQENLQKYPDANAFYKDYYNGIMGAYGIKDLAVTEVKNWNGGYALAKGESGDDCVINSKGKYLVKDNYGKIYSYSPNENLLAIEHEEQLVYVNLSEQRKRVPYSETIGWIYYDYLGSFNSGLAPFCDRDGKWGYVYDNMNIYTSGLEGATEITDGLFAYKSEGKWKVCHINRGQRNSISDFSYDEIYVDEYNRIAAELFTIDRNSKCAVIYAKNSGDAGWRHVYIELNYGKEPYFKAVTTSGNCYEDVELFRGEAGAVKTAAGWSFINRDGTEATAIGNGYEDAGSFGCGMAPVKVDGKWGYINSEGVMVIHPVFDHALSFGSDGAAIVEIENETSLITLVEHTIKK